MDIPSVTSSKSLESQRNSYEEFNLYRWKYNSRRSPLTSIVLEAMNTHYYYYHIYLIPSSLMVSFDACKCQSHIQMCGVRTR